MGAQFYFFSVFLHFMQRKQPILSTVTECFLLTLLLVYDVDSVRPEKDHGDRDDERSIITIF